MVEEKIIISLEAKKGLRSREIGSQIYLKINSIEADLTPAGYGHF